MNRSNLAPHKGAGFFLKGRPMKITFDNKEYDLDDLSNEAKAQLSSIQFVEAELMRLQAQAAALQTARMAYAKALQELLPSLPTSDTVKFS